MLGPLSSQEIRETTRIHENAQKWSFWGQNHGFGPKIGPKVRLYAVWLPWQPITTNGIVIYLVLKLLHDTIP